MGFLAARDHVRVAFLVNLEGFRSQRQATGMALAAGQVNPKFLPWFLALSDRGQWADTMPGLSAGEFEVRDGLEEFLQCDDDLGAPQV